MKPLVIDLFCGLGGWAEGFLSEGYTVIGFDIERRPYPGRLVLQDALTLQGSQFRNAACIVASPPCQKYSYMAMPWKRGKRMAAEIWADRDGYRALPPGGKIRDLNALFDACFRIQREASEATGRDCPACGGKGFMVWYVNETHPCERCDGKGYVYRQIPMVVENVKGAQPWVGRAKWHYGSFYLWGDVPALMPFTAGMKMGRAPKAPNGVTKWMTNPGEWKPEDRSEYGSKNSGGSWFNQAHNTESGHGQNPDGRKVPGIKLSEVGFNVAAARQIDPSEKPADFVRTEDMSRQHIGYSRAQASAKIAMIPFPLAQHIARTFYPCTGCAQ